MADEVYDGAIGIDLGTTYSCVANYEGAGVEIIANEQGSFTTPSFVSFTSEERLIGEAAKNQAAMNPANTVFDVKRLIGRRFDDPTVKKDVESWPFKVIDDDGSPRVQVEYLNETKSFSPQEISAMVLGKMKEVAEVKLDTADLLLLDVVPLSLGVAMEGNIFAPVVPRGATVPTLKKRTFTTVADNQQTVQFPVFQGERVNCEDNTSLGEFTLAPIPPMKAGDAVLEVVFEVDVNGILKVTATEKTSGRSANITISNSVGKLSSGEIEKMVEDAAKFKSSDDAFSKKFESRQQLESYISRVEEIVSDPTMSMKLKRGQKEKIESALSDAMAQLEIEDASSDDLKKKELALKRVVTKAMSTR
nr:ribosome-associated molecular chaperone ssb1 [Quercus suber]